MMKILNIAIILSVLSLFNSSANGETKPDCSQYSTKTLVGIIDKTRCLRGKPVKSRVKAEKSRDESEEVIKKKELACHEYSTKTFTGLIAKLKCERK